MENDPNTGEGGSHDNQAPGGQDDQIPTPDSFTYYLNASTPASVVSEDGRDDASRHPPYNQRAHLNEIELSSSRIHNAVTALDKRLNTLVGQVTQLHQDLTSVKNSNTDLAGRIGRVEKAVTGCQDAEIHATEEISRVRSSLEERARTDEERETEQQGLRETVGLVTGAVEDIKAIKEKLDDEARRNRSDLWSDQLRDFLITQEETTHQHRVELLRGLRPATDQGGRGAGEEGGESDDSNTAPNRNPTGQGRPPGRSPLDKRPKLDTGTTKKIPSKMPVTCPDCGAQYSTIASMRRHLYKDGTCPRAWPGSIPPKTKEDHKLQRAVTPTNVDTQRGGSGSSTLTSTPTESEYARASREMNHTLGRTRTWNIYKPDKSRFDRKCGQCNYSTDNQTNLTRHLRMTHGGNGTMRFEVGETGGASPGPGDDKDNTEAGAAAEGAGEEDRPDQTGTTTGGEAAGAEDVEDPGDGSEENIISDNEEGPTDATKTDAHGNPVLRSPFKRQPSQRREDRE